MLYKARISANKSRRRGRPGPVARLGSMLFRLGEFGAVAFFVFAAVKAHQAPVSAGVPLDVYVSFVLGLACFGAGWAVREALSHKS